MRNARLACIAFVAAFAGSGAAAQTAASDSVRALDAKWASSYATHDTVFARALIDSSVVITSSAGARKTRDQELDDVRPAAGLAMHYFRSRDVDVRVYSATAIVAGLAEWEFEAGGQTRALRRRYTATYVRGGPLG
jgi:hypothetical protein